MNRREGRLGALVHVVVAVAAGIVGFEAEDNLAGTVGNAAVLEEVV